MGFPQRVLTDFVPVDQSNCSIGGRSFPFFFLPKAMLILFGPWYKSGTSLGVSFYAIYTTEGRTSTS